MNTIFKTLYAIAGVFVLTTQSIMAFGPYVADFQKIVDGDTFDAVLNTYPDTFRHVRIRLDVDTPEKRGLCEYETMLGLMATDAAESILSDARQINVMVQGEDAFGRALGVVTVDGVDLGAELTRRGLAKPFKRGRNENWCSCPD